MNRRDFFKQCSVALLALAFGKIVSEYPDEDPNIKPLLHFDENKVYNDIGTVFTNRGAAGAVTFTLPPLAEFFVVTDQSITLPGQVRQ